MSTNCILESANLDVQNFNPFWFPISIPLFWPFVTGSDKSRWDHITGELNSAIAQITADSQTNGTFLPLKMKALHSYETLRTAYPTTQHHDPLRPQSSETMLWEPQILHYSVLVLQTSCYVPYCSIQTWRLRYQRGQISCYEWEWHLPQHFCKLLL